MSVRLKKCADGRYRDCRRRVEVVNANGGRAGRDRVYQVFVDGHLLPVEATCLSDAEGLAWREMRDQGGYR